MTQMDCFSGVVQVASSWTDELKGRLCITDQLYNTTLSVPRLSFLFTGWDRTMFVAVSIRHNLDP